MKLDNKLFIKDYTNSLHKTISQIDEKQIIECKKIIFNRDSQKIINQLN